MKSNKPYIYWIIGCIGSELTCLINTNKGIVIGMIVITVILQLMGNFIIKKINGNKMISTILIFIMMSIPMAFLGTGTVIAVVTPLLYGFSGYLSDEYGEPYIYSKVQSLVTVILSSIVVMINYWMAINNFHIANIYTTIIVTVSTMTQVGVLFRESDKSKEDLRDNIDKVKRQSNIDALTGLYNRKMMDECINEQINSIHAFSVIIMDIDNFKKVNDTYGHAFGDVVLKGLAENLKKITRGKDIAFRYGGEEFVVVCPHTALKDGLAVAERIRSSFNERPFTFEDQELHFSISLGVSECLYHEYDEAMDIIKNSDAALYHSKKTGKNKVTSFLELEEEEKKINDETNKRNGEKNV